MSHYQFPHDKSFPVLESTIEHVSAKLLELHHGHAEKKFIEMPMNILWGNINIS
jgi:hypothetical protein